MLWEAVLTEDAAFGVQDAGAQTPGPPRLGGLSYPCFQSSLLAELEYWLLLPQQFDRLFGQLYQVPRPQWEILKV